MHDGRWEEDWANVTRVMCCQMEEHNAADIDQGADLVLGPGTHYGLKKMLIPVMTRLDT